MADETTAIDLAVQIMSEVGSEKKSDEIPAELAIEQPKRRKSGTPKELLQVDPEEEVTDIPGDFDEDGLVEHYKDRYNRGIELQQKMKQLGIPTPREPSPPELIRDELGQVIAPVNITTLSSQHLGEYHSYYTGMMVYVGHLLWVADVNRQMANSVRAEVEGFFDHV
jgi:hypothetical protein